MTFSFFSRSALFLLFLFVLPPLSLSFPTSAAFTILCLRGSVKTIISYTAPLFERAIVDKEAKKRRMPRQIKVIFYNVLFLFFFAPDTEAFRGIPGSLQRRSIVATKGHNAVPTLEEWVVLPNGRIQGKIRNHPDIEDGSVISTSPIHDPEEAVGRDVVSVQTLSGSQYLLVDPSPDMEQVMASDNYFAMPTEGMQVEEEQSETKKLMQQVKDAGVAGVISYALWELGFWTISVPVCVAAYRQLTGHWPDFSNQEDLKQLGAEAFAFVNVARFAVPLRIGLALGTTPWIQTNIVDRFSKKGEY